MTAGCIGAAGYSCKLKRSDDYPMQIGRHFNANQTVLKYTSDEALDL
jgi:hypothetical protein